MYTFLSYSGLLWINIFAAAFLAVLFLQSGLDKVMNWQSEKDYLQQHFAKSLLKNTIGILFPILTLFELSAGIFNAFGLLQLIITKERGLAQIGILIAALSLTSLFFGQRISKDYAGASTIVTYFVLVILGMYFVFI